MKARLQESLQDVSAQVLREVDGVEIWKRLLQQDKPQVVASVMEYLTDRVFGKPAQIIQGDPHKPVAVHLSWSAPMPDWLENVVDLEVHEPEKLEP